jgi:plastocyanin
MTRHKKMTSLAVLALGAAAAIVPVAASSAGASTPKKVIKTVKVQDDFYAPIKLRLNTGTEVRWVWSKSNFDSHNVTLIKGPKGIKAKAWTSATGSSGIIFNRTFTKPGTYHFQCEIHPESMNLTVVVKG